MVNILQLRFMFYNCFLLLSVKVSVVDALLELGADVFVTTCAIPANPYLPAGVQTKRILPLEVALFTGHLVLTAKIFEKMPEGAINASTVKMLLNLAVKEMAYELVERVIEQYCGTALFMLNC